MEHVPIEQLQKPVAKAFETLKLKFNHTLLQQQFTYFFFFAILQPN
jgi:hypothetical protein